MKFCVAKVADFHIIKQYTNSHLNEKDNFYFAHHNNSGIYIYANLVFLVDKFNHIYYLGNSYYIFCEMHSYRF